MVRAVVVALVLVLGWLWLWLWFGLGRVQHTVRQAKLGEWAYTCMYACTCMHIHAHAYTCVHMHTVRQAKLGEWADQTIDAASIQATAVQSA